MTSDFQTSLADCRRSLKRRLDDCFTRKDDPNPSKRFARNGITREILNEATLYHLFKLLNFTDNHVLSGTDDQCLKSLVSVVRGLEMETSPSPPEYCNILATLLYARCTDECLRSWAKTLSHQRSHDHEPRPFNDNDLPLTEPAAQKSFGDADGHCFWELQFLFCPITLKESVESVYVDHERSCRLPFTEERTKIGSGNFARVYKVKIEKGHMVNQSSGLALQHVGTSHS